MPIGSGSYSLQSGGTFSGMPGGIGGGQPNIMGQIARRWLGQMQGPPAGAVQGSPEADAAMARMLGLPGAPPPPVGQQAPQPAGLEGIGAGVQQRAQMPVGVGLAARQAQAAPGMSKAAVMAAARPPMPGASGVMRNMQMPMRPGGSMGLAALGRPPVGMGGV